MARPIGKQSEEKADVTIRVYETDRQKINTKLTRRKRAEPDAIAADVVRDLLKGDKHGK